MFHNQEKSRKPSDSANVKNLIPLSEASVLLSETKRQNVLKRIRQSTGFNQTRYDSIGQSLIVNIANHCQLLPETSNSYFAQPGGLLDYAIHRTDAALELFRSYTIQAEEGVYTEEQNIWLYALLSASLLQGLGKLQADYRVNLYDAKRQCLKEWYPLIEALNSVGQFYSYEFLDREEEDFRKRLNLMIAKLLMPTSGFAWIASNKKVLAVWLALLNEDLYAAGTLGAILIRADAIAIQRYFNEILARFPVRDTNRIGTFIDKPNENILTKEQMVGLEFIKWIAKSLDEGKLLINKAPLMMVPGGLLISHEAFKLFMRHHPEYKNWQALLKSLAALKIHQVGYNGTITSRFEQIKTQEMVQGIVIKNYAIALPKEVQVRHMITGEISKLSATEMIHQAYQNKNFQAPPKEINQTALLYLNPNGEWRKQTTQSPQLGIKKSG